MIQEAVNVRLEADYGIQYVLKAFSENGKFASRELALSYTELQKGKMAMGRFLMYVGSPNPYPNSTNVDNQVIEPQTEKVIPEDVKVNPDFNNVTHIKFLRNGLTNLIDKVLDMRMRPLSGVKNPKHNLMATQSLNEALSSFEMAFNWMGTELRRISDADPGKYPTSGPEVAPSPEAGEKRSEVEKTAELMNERVAGTQSPDDPARPYTGADYLPGGRLYKG